MPDRTLTDADVAAIRARAEAATPGPWATDANCDFVGSFATNQHICETAGHGAFAHDMIFIAACRKDIPALLSDRDALLAERDSWRRVAERLEREKLDALARAETAERQSVELRKLVSNRTKLAIANTERAVIAEARLAALTAERLAAGGREQAKPAPKSITDFMQEMDASVAAQLRELISFANKTPILTSLLYDINLLPEQIREQKHLVYMIAVIEHFRVAMEGTATGEAANG